MTRRSHVVVAVALFALAGCGSQAAKEPAPKATSKAAPEPTSKDLGEVSSVVELRDALVDAGYSCKAWEQRNVVDLAAESGQCDDSDLLATFASEGDLQEQLDTYKSADEMFLDADIELDPYLVGPNWIFRAPSADQYAMNIGGTVVGPPS